MSTEELSSPVQPMTDRRRRTRERILTAAQRVFAQRGITGASVEEICEEADFTRGAFYSNFSGKDELVRSLFEYYCDQIFTDVTAAAQSFTEIADGEERLRRCAAELGAMMPRSRTMLLTSKEMQLYAVKVPELRDALMQYQEEEFGVVEGIIRELLHDCGREFSLAEDTALELLAGAYEYAILRALETAPVEATEVDFDFGPLTDLLILLTRPVG